MMKIDGNGRYQNQKKLVEVNRVSNFFVDEDNNNWRFRLFHVIKS